MPIGAYKGCIEGIYGLPGGSRYGHSGVVTALKTP